MTGRKLLFTDIRQVAVTAKNELEPAPNEVRVKVRYSAISPGSELLLYRGLLPRDLQLDSTIEALADGWQYPVAYGYAAVGQVEAVGAEVEPEWLGRAVFAFQPHASHFVARPDQLLPIPAGVTLKNALFLPNMETAVSFAMDGQPIIGENVLIMGQGIVGLLTAILLAQMPLGSLTTVDHYASRRERSRQFSAALALAPEELATETKNEFDLAYELSGNSKALDQAIAVTGDYGRIVIGSWYGEKRAELNLGGSFHRSHMKLISSQVSELKPEWTGRWDKTRRLNLAWEMIRRHDPARFISHYFNIEEAAQAYEMLDQTPDQCLQTIFTYEGG